jgi:hypothetical protein
VDDLDSVPDDNRFDLASRILTLGLLSCKQIFVSAIVVMLFGAAAPRRGQVSFPVVILSKSSSTQWRWRNYSYYPLTKRRRGKWWVELDGLDHSTVHLACTVPQCTNGYGKSSPKIMPMFSACTVHAGRPWLMSSPFLRSKAVYDFLAVLLIHVQQCTVRLSYLRFYESANMTQILWFVLK